MIDYMQVDRTHIPTPREVAVAQQDLRLARVSSGLGASPLATFAGNMATSTFRSVTIRSQITPDFTYDPNAPTRPASGLSEWVLKNIIRPTVEVQTPAGPVQLAPYGPPRFNLFPLLVIGSVAFAGGVGYLAIKGLIKK
jgi:hypothetical protein